ncbi:MAG TPA: hypothetical protein VIN59_08040 [Alphaproteobacteria bacterium]
MTKQKSRVLILTDSVGHSFDDSLFPMAVHLSENPLIDAVYVADRADPANAGFYTNLDVGFNAFSVRKVNALYAYTTEHDFAAREKITADDFDAVWIRIDHPVSAEFLGYVRARFPNHFIMNDPQGLIRTMSKEFLPELAHSLGDMIPAAVLCNTAEEVEAFKGRFSKGVVLKQVLSYGGKGVVRYRDDTDATELHNKKEVADYLAENGMCLVMEYLDPPTEQSDNRVVVMNGEVLCVLKRTPMDGGWLCNITSGGSAVNDMITQREIDIAKRLDPMMRENGIFLYGVDMLLNSKGERVISEINTLNVGGMIESELMSGRPLTKMIADALAIIIGARDINADSKEEMVAA